MHVLISPERGAVGYLAWVGIICSRATGKEFDFGNIPLGCYRKKTRIRPAHKVCNAVISDTTESVMRPRLFICLVRLSLLCVWGTPRLSCIRIWRECSASMGLDWLNFECFIPWLRFLQGTNFVFPVYVINHSDLSATVLSVTASTKLWSCVEISQSQSMSQLPVHCNSDHTNTE